MSTGTLRSSGIRVAAERWARTAVPAAIEAGTRELEELYRDAHARWPVATGRSRAALRLVFRRDASQASGKLVDTAPYVTDIRARKLGGRSPWTELVVLPWRGRRLPALLRRLRGRAR